MKTTVVPGRNLIFLSILAGLAETCKADQIALGVHSGDYAIYPDCRPEFVKAARMTIGFATNWKVNLVTPFIDMQKEDIVFFGNTHNVPFELTRTCYQDHPVACGKCGACVERLEAFKLQHIKDPLTYQLVNIVTPHRCTICEQGKVKTI